MTKLEHKQLNIRWHILKRKLIEINYFSDDASYREWLLMYFDAKSSKELSDEQMANGIERMAESYNKYSKEGKEK